MKKLILISTAALMMVACGKDRDKNPANNANEAAKDAALQNKTFESQCNKDPVAGMFTDVLSHRVQYRFTGNNVTRTTIYFSAIDCSNEAYRFEERGQIFIGKAGEATGDLGRALDMHFKTVRAQTRAENGVNVANKNELCGRKDWKKDDKNGVDVTGKSKELQCYNMQVPRSDYQIYRVEDGFLYLGESNKPTNPSAARPTKLDRSEAKRYTAI